ncbi:Coenzyme Q-binding protein coq10 [Paramyrothecium foliicola]|nr:Coenzyme Q-binding protein coq10 [Paramyrothecium foliicola]
MALRTALRVPLRAQPLSANLLRRSAIASRPFITFPGSDTQDLHATRVLPYASDPLYELIADVDSYSQFVPYCAISRVTQWSAPDANGRRWPALADLHVGWGGFNETFTSRLHCEPGAFVEAVSGDAQSGGPGGPASVFKSLVTRWSLRPLANQPAPSTEVRLSIKYQFVNPLYAAVSAAVSDKVAGMMVEAFEQRARERLGARERRL